VVPADEVDDVLRTALADGWSVREVREVRQPPANEVAGS
jgi:hypothetical protein